MTIVTVWEHTDTKAIKLFQLGDSPEDGSPDEQIAFLGTLSFCAGYVCVCPEFTGTVPDVDPTLWQWNGTDIVAKSSAESNSA